MLQGTKRLGGGAQKEGAREGTKAELLECRPAPTLAGLRTPGHPGQAGWGWPCGRLCFLSEVWGGGPRRAFLVTDALRGLGPRPGSGALGPWGRRAAVGLAHHVMPRTEPAAGFWDQTRPTQRAGGGEPEWVGPGPRQAQGGGTGTGVSLPQPGTTSRSADSLLTPSPLLSRPGPLWAHPELTAWGPRARGPSSLGSLLPGAPAGTRTLAELGGPESHTDGSVVGRVPPPAGPREGSLPVGWGEPGQRERL